MMNNFYRNGNGWGMMGNQGGGPVGNLFLWDLHWVLGLLTWILVIAVLFALLRWLWRKGNGK